MKNTQRAIVVLLSLSATGANSAERYEGFATFGCRDSFIKVSGERETWFLELPPEQKQGIIRLAHAREETPWLTLAVSLEGRLKDQPAPGYFEEHRKRLVVERVLAARFPEKGETVSAATAEARPFKGYLIVTWESVGFVPLERQGEFWWVVSGKALQNEFLARFNTKSNGEGQPDSALVEIVGRVGPPGLYGHLSSSTREIAVDKFTYIRKVVPDEMIGTAAFIGTEPEINRCGALPRK